MDNNHTPSRAPRADKTAATPSHRDKADEKSKAPAYRSTKYKEKFQTMRDTYERVTAVKDNYQRELQNANERIKLLEEENNLLLDAMHFASFTQPNLACQLRVLYEEDKREKWIRDHPEQYAELLRRGIMLPPDGDPRIMHQDVNGNAQHPSGHDRTNEFPPDMIPRTGD